MKQGTKNKIIRRCIFAAAAVAVFLLQYTASFAFHGSFFPTGLLLPFTISVAMAEREYAGLCFGLLAGVLTDTASSVTDGVFTLYFAIIACAAGLLAHYVFRDTVLTAVLFSSVAAVIYSGILLTYNCLIHDIVFTGELIKRIYLPSVILTAIITPVFYFPCKALHNSLKADLNTD